MDKTDYKKLGERIRATRKSKKLTIEQLSELIEKSWQYVGNIERAEGIPSLSTVISIAAALGVSTDYLLYGDVSEQNKKESDSDIYNPLLFKLRTLSKDEQKAVYDFLCKFKKGKGKP
jgi:transcriptional regulator with XRE-family HTH domain